MLYFVLMPKKLKNIGITESRKHSKAMGTIIKKSRVHVLYSTNCFEFLVPKTQSIAHNGLHTEGQAVFLRKYIETISQRTQRSHVCED